ncbi:MAG TPA: secretin N-terminal domain-containing protein, partial [Abditibacteriaceae bacterium]
RSPLASRKRLLEVEKLAPSPAQSTAQFRIHALNTPLATLLEKVAEVSGTSVSASADAVATSVSLHLPSATVDDLVTTLQNGYGLVAVPDGEGTLLGREGSSLPTERLQLNYLSPERARLLFPDFLLSSLRADRENNALLATGPPRLLARLREDLKKLDLPRPQVRVEATAWEFASSKEANLALNALRRGRESRVAFNTARGTASFQIGAEETQQFQANIDALVAKKRARLAAQPFLVVASGENGTFFLGQRRYITVLQQRDGQQSVSALQLQIGYTLDVTPLVGRDDDITLELRPRVSTVDDIDIGTGLPTLGIREISAAVRVRPGDSVIVAGLDSDLRFDTRRKSGLARVPLLGKLFRSRNTTRPLTSMIILVKASRI